MKYFILIMLSVTAIFAKPSMKTAVEDKSIYGVQTKVEQNDTQEKIEIKEPFKGDTIKEPIIQKKDFHEDTSSESDKLPKKIIKKEPISTHEKFKKEYTGGTKIKASYNPKIFEALEKTIPAGASHSSGGGGD